MKMIKELKWNVNLECVDRDTNLSPSSRLIFGLIYSKASDRDNTCNWGIRDMANYFGFSYKTVMRSIKELEERNYIKKKKNAGFRDKYIVIDVREIFDRAEKNNGRGMPRGGEHPKNNKLTPYQNNSTPRTKTTVQDIPTNTPTNTPFSPFRFFSKKIDLDETTLSQLAAIGAAFMELDPHLKPTSRQADKIIELLDKYGLEAIMEKFKYQNDHPEIMAVKFFTPSELFRKWFKIESFMKAKIQGGIDRY